MNTKDYYSDYGHNFVKIFKNIELPEFVKEASMLPEEDLSLLRDESFADKIARRLPMASAADTYISIAYDIFCNNKDKNISDSLTKAAKFWEIEDEVNQLKAHLSELSKEASEEDESPSWEVFHKLAHETISGSGDTQDGLLLAYSEFNKVANRYPYKERVAIAKKYAKEFDKMGSEIPFSLGAMAELNFPDADIAAQEIKSRSIRLNDFSKRATLIKIADSFLESDDRSLSGYSDLAETLDIIDEQEGLRRFYGKQIKNAHEAIFNTPKESAIEQCGTLKIASGEYSIEDLKAIDSEIFRIALTPEDYEFVTK